MTTILSDLALVFTGMCIAVGYVCWRIMRVKGNDKSNVHNPLRALGHIVVHPEDMRYMRYVDRTTGESRAAFPYLSHDEITDVVETRPTSYERW